jgi:hypothetical protein
MMLIKLGVAFYSLYNVDFYTVESHYERRHTIWIQLLRGILLHVVNEKKI